MKILFLNPPFKFKISRASRWPEYTKSGTLYYPFWLAYATGVSMQNYEVMLLDAIAKELSEKEVIKQVKKFDPDLLVVETSTPTFKSDVKFIEKLRKEVETKIAFVGTHVSVFPEEALKSKAVDFVARKEYDYTILELANTLEKNDDLKKVLGLSFKEKGKIIHNPDRPPIQNLDALPFVSKVYKEFLDVKAYRYALALHPMIQILSSRGCPNLCTFCVGGETLITVKNRNLVYTLPIKELVNELLKKRKIEFMGNEVADVSDLNIYILSRKGFVKLKRVSKVRRDAKIKIKMEKGFFLTLGEDHILPVIRNGKRTLIKAFELRVGDTLSAPLPRLMFPVINQLDLSIELWKNARSHLKDVYIHSLHSVFKYLESKKKFQTKKIKKSWKIRGILPIKEFIRLRKKYKVPQELLKILKIGGKNLREIPLLLKVDENLMRLLGLFVAEGNYNQYNLVITNSDFKLLSNLKNLIKRVFPDTYLGFSPPTEERGGQIFFGGKLIYLIFNYIFRIKRGAINKTIPWIVFNQDLKKIGAFLSGLFTGDGSLKEGKITYASISKTLSLQLLFLLRMLGMNPSLMIEKPRVTKMKGRNISGRAPIYICYIASWDDRERFLRHIGFMDERQEKLESLQNEKKPLRIKVLEVLDNPKTTQQISHELGISQAMVRYLVTKLNHKGFVQKRIIGKNGFIKYVTYEKVKKENLMDRRAQLLKIVKIERENKSDWLFDLETADGYFIANCIEVHNCDWPQNFMGRLYRTRSPENFVDELEFIANEMPEIKEIFIEDDTFSIIKHRVVKICDLIKERRLDIIWSANVRADIPFYVLKKMKDAGCRVLVVGYESGNQQILNNVKKGITLEQAEKFTIAAKNAGLKIFGCFMIGLPGETKETIEQTFQFAKKLNPDMAFFQQAVPFPGTEFYNWCKQNGYLVTEDFSKWLDSNGQLDFLVSYPNLTNEELRKIRDNLMLRFYLSPKHIWQTITHNLSFDEMQRVFNAAKDYFSYLIKSRAKK